MIDFLIETIVYYPIWASAILISSAIAMYFAFIRLWIFFNIIFTFTSKIMKLKLGQVEIKGRVKAIDIIDGIDKKAVYYKKVDEVWVSGKNGGWRAENPEKIVEIFHTFKVVDNTGEVTVIPFNGKSFDIKEEITQLDKLNRIRYHFLEDNEEVYVLGNFSIVNDEPIITKKEGTPFIISDFKEMSLIIKHAFFGFGITLLVVIVISISLFFASLEWNKSWEGSLERKDFYVSGKNTDYKLYLTGGDVIDTSKTEYNRVKSGDYLIKHKKSYDLEIRPQK